MAADWDLTALINAADPKSSLPERHLWLVRLMEWLRHAPRTLLPPLPAASDDGAKTPLPVLRLRHLLNQLDKHAELRERVQRIAQAFWREIDAASLFADFGFGGRVSFGHELRTRLQAMLLPSTPETRDLAALFTLLFRPSDRSWVDALDTATVARAARLLGPGPDAMQALLLDAVTILVSAVHAAGFAPALRQRMDPDVLEGRPFRQLTRAAATLRDAVQDGRRDDALREAAFLRALLDSCRRAAASVLPHLEQYGVSVNIVFDLEQLLARTLRIEMLVDALLAPDPAAEGRRLLHELVRVQGEQQGLRSLLAQHYSLLARRVAERHADTGERYITTNRAEHREMLRRAAGGGLVIAGTTFAKFALMALGLSAFWGGFAAGTNYAVSFVVVMLMHWTVATKQPAMTAPAMAATLPSPAAGSAGSPHTDDEIEAFVDRVAQLIRSQAAGIAGNVAMCVPVVLAVQLLAAWVLGEPFVGAKEGEHVVKSLTLLGPTPLFAAFTGVLLFASSLVAGWAENWFVFHRLDSAIAWHPWFVARLGPRRAQRWARWWRDNVSGLAGNISLGLLLGLVPAVLAFFAVPLDVRHVTLASGQLAAALGAIGPSLLLRHEFWWCVAGIAATGVLNVTVSFYLAFKVAERSRGVRLKERSRIAAALRARVRRAPLSFLWPPKDAG